MQTATVRYQVATYSGEIEVQCHEDDDNDVIEAKARRQLERKAGPFPFGCQSFQVVERN